MARTIYICGNDGSGKSTYARRLAQRARARGLTVVHRHYYRSLVRRCLRGIIERLLKVSTRKRTGPGGQAGKTTAATFRKRRYRTMAILAFLGIYQTCMALEAWCRDRFCRANLLVMDRGFIDDLASILVTFRLPAPLWLVRCSAQFFPMRQIIFLAAGHETEYLRIIAMDLSQDLHRAKSEHYDRIVRSMEKLGVAIRRVNTGRPTLGANSLSSNGAPTRE